MNNRVFPLSLQHDELFQAERAQQIPYHRMYGKEYCVPAVVLYTPKEIDKLREASVKINRIFQKGVRFVQRYLPDLLLVNQLGIHPALLSAARMEVPFHGVSRQDWIINSSGMKLIENNTDTPTGIPETAFLAESVLSEFTSFENPSKTMNHRIQSSFTALMEFYRSCGLTGEIAFSCYDWHEEDYCNTVYLMEQVRQAGFPAWFAPLEKLEVRSDQGLFYEGKKIDIWYRLYPLEYLVHDTDEDGFPTGEAILSLIEQRKLAIINPVQSIISQSKGFLALIWSLFEKNERLPELIGAKTPLFTKEECDTIQEFMLPTYFDPSPFRQSGRAWVAKAIFGREGKGTVLYKEDGQPETIEWEHELDQQEDEATKAYYGEQPCIYQQRIPLERIEIPTEQGHFNGYLLTGAFVIGGSYAGLLPRVGGEVTGNLAYYAVAGMKD